MVRQHNRAFSVGRRRSASISNTCWPALARTVARLVAMVLLPSPEFGLVITTLRTGLFPEIDKTLLASKRYELA